MTCPSCRRLNDQYADHCECGYAFQGSQTNAAAVLGSIDRSVRMIKNIVLWWAILTIAAAALWAACGAMLR